MRKAEQKPQIDASERSAKTRWILLGAFGGMLLMMILAGVDSLRSLQKLNQVSNEVTQQFATRSHALVAVVVSFHTYTDQMEQYLLSDEIVSNAPALAEVTTRGAAVHLAVGNYPNDCAPEERSLLGKIDEQVSSQESRFSGVLANSTTERKRRGRTFVFEELMPRRVQVLQLASALSVLNDKRFGEQNTALVLQFQGLQARLARMVFLTLVAGLLLSLVAGYYILRLEKRGRERYLALSRSRQELESLSRRLVDAQEAERRSISRELHDEVGQTLGALLMDIGRLSSLLSPGDKLNEEIARIKAAAETAVKSIRDMALLLRPPMLDDLGLVPALEWQARETSRQSDMEVDIHAEEFANDPPDEVRVCIYRVVQEALRNAATHAHAKNANVMLKRKEHSIVVEISDDGEGFQPERMRGMGILGMEERVRQLQGTFLIRSEPGKGATVHAELPIGRVP
ncbi:MAG TPA: sensor histidine kinase [Terriglobales bacterium]|nr:sensor histidine kinase [Terriglobales bacterium]